MDKETNGREAIEVAHFSNLVNTKSNSTNSYRQQPTRALSTVNLPKHQLATKQRVLQPSSTTRRPFTSSSRRHAYANTISNLAINPSTTVIYQGFTGRAATANATATLEYGTRIVGGVSPNKPNDKATHLDLPLFSTCRAAAAVLKPAATAVFVPAHSAATAIEEAIEAEIPLIVSVAEHIPVHDMLRVQEALRSQSKSRLVGPNCPGIINPIARVRIGIMPHLQFLPG